MSNLDFSMELSSSCHRDLMGNSLALYFSQLFEKPNKVGAASAAAIGAVSAGHAGADPHSPFKRKEKKKCKKCKKSNKSKDKRKVSQSSLVMMQ